LYSESPTGAQAAVGGFGSIPYFIGIVSKFSRSVDNQSNKCDYETNDYEFYHRGGATHAEQPRKHL